MTDQLTRADLNGMTPEQITDAFDAGRLAVTLGQYAPDEAPLIDRARHGAITRADIADLARLGRHDLIAAAVDDRRIITKEN